MLTLKEAEWRVGRSSVYYLCNFSVNLNFFHHKKFFKTQLYKPHCVTHILCWESEIAVRAHVPGVCGTRTQPQVSVSPRAYLVIPWDVFFSLEMSYKESFSTDFIKNWLMVGALPYDKTEFEKCLPVLNLLHSHGWVLPLVSLNFVETSWCNSCFVVTLFRLLRFFGGDRGGGFQQELLQSFWNDVF